MKKLLIAAAVALLAGCSNSVPKYEINNAESQCSTHTGVYKIEPGGGFYCATAICNDGVRVSIDANKGCT